MPSSHLVIGAGPTGTQTALLLAEAGDTVTVATRRGSDFYVVVNGADLNPSIRTVDGAEKVAHRLRELGFVTGN